MIRPIQIVQGKVALTAKAIYDYDFTPVVPIPLETPEAYGSLWGDSGTAEELIVSEAGEQLITEDGLDDIVTEGTGVDASGGKWDEAYWDLPPSSQSLVFGNLGMGRTVAVAMKGSANSRLTFIGWDLTYTKGGFL
jgi:hypothetical protein